MSSKSAIIGELRRITRMTGKKSVFLTTSSLRNKVNLEKWGIKMKGSLLYCTYVCLLITILSSNVSVPQSRFRDK